VNIYRIQLIESRCKMHGFQPVSLLDTTGSETMDGYNKRSWSIHRVRKHSIPSRTIHNLERYRKMKMDNLNIWLCRWCIKNNIELNMLMFIWQKYYLKYSFWTVKVSLCRYCYMFIENKPLGVDNKWKSSKVRNVIFTWCNGLNEKQKTPWLVQEKWLNIIFEPLTDYHR
jgi:hypothetical protein